VELRAGFVARYAEPGSSRTVPIGQKISYLSGKANRQAKSCKDAEDSGFFGCAALTSE
jgi:hypothetical protein